VACIFSVNFFWISEVHARTLKIATWNIEHLAEANGAGCRPRTDADYAELKRIVDEEIQGDIIAFQEVQSRAAAERVFDPAQYTIEYTTQPSSSPFPCGEHTSTDQRVGFAIRKGVNYKRESDFAEIGLRNTRHSVQIKLFDTGGIKPVTLLAVHLKASCPSDDYEDSFNRDCRTLRMQIPLLEAWMEERFADQSGFIVLGDFNRMIDLDREPTTPAIDEKMWRELDDGAPRGIGLTQLTPHVKWHCRWQHLDHMIADADTAFYAKPDTAKTIDIVKGGSPLTAPSDHCPIVVTLDFDQAVEEKMALRRTEKGETKTGSLSASARSAALRWIQNSAEYKALAQATYHAATARVEQLAAGPSLAGKSWVVAIDADETLIDNSEFEAREQRLSDKDKEATKFDDRWAYWVKERSAKAIPGALAFVARVLSLGGKVAIITNREAEFSLPNTDGRGHEKFDGAEATWDNFKKLGLPDDRSHICMLARTNKQVAPFANDKDQRRALLATGQAEACWRGAQDPAIRAAWAQPQQVILHIGDNVQDFPSIAQAAAAKEPGIVVGHLGRDWFLLPNPVYGSWR
jgi:5'-nucleotidase (lipoprotein e(P4) family)